MGKVGPGIPIQFFYFKNFSCSHSCTISLINSVIRVLPYDIYDINLWCAILKCRLDYRVKAISMSSRIKTVLAGNIAALDVFACIYRGPNDCGIRHLLKLSYSIKEYVFFVHRSGSEESSLPLVKRRLRLRSTFADCI